ncbi:MAG: serpin family protein [Lachnospiraceae bacterium]|nr:serpin family protein [Lachnospiraceae bacterium]
MKKELARLTAIFVTAAMSVSGCGSTPQESTISSETAASEESSKDISSDTESTDTESSTEVSEAGTASADLEEAETLDDTLKNSINTFNWKLFDSADAENNLFYSPYSIASAIALADLGAKGTTKEEIEAVLGIDDLETFEQQIKLFAENNTSDTAKLTTANSVWIDKSLSLSDEYEEVFKNPAEFYFDGELKSVDFKNDTENVKKEISSWVSDKTDKLIDDYESVADGNTVADILNAVYFYGEWSNKFSAEDTESQKFKGTEGDSFVDMMHMEDNSFSYVENVDGITAVALPYSNSSIEMDIMMSADESKDLDDVWDSSNSEKIFSSLDEADTSEISELELPKFEMDVTFDGLKDSLESLGINSAFSKNADFTGIAENLTVSDISHRAKVEVNEDGTKAAAVTEMTMELTAMKDEGENIKFIVDRPFIFTIRDRESGMIIFTGRVNNL